MVHRLRQRGAHDGELQQVLGRAVHVRAKVQHRGGAARLVRNGRGDRRAVNAVQRLEHITGNGHPGAGVARGNAGVRPPILDGLGSEAHGGVFFAAQGDLDRVVHGDDFGSRHDLNVIARHVAVLGERRFDGVGKPDQQ